ncbi:unnamed protein product [Cyclocybe aegerita]|uniref:F-box domain-containing protein n=1 Tax=Cyclocybe aegerita TaxID=1973307 RepID=A0A8S0VQU9_CYCAE|nr:unnamed protein product [Cyclocybe aegerita]
MLDLLLGLYLVLQRIPLYSELRYLWPTEHSCSMDSLRVQIHGPQTLENASSGTTGRSLYYSWKVKEPGIFSLKTKGFDPERVAVSSPEMSRLVPMSHDLSSYIQGIGIAPTQVEAVTLEELRSTRQKEVREMESRRDEMLLSIKALCEDLLAMEETMEGKTREAAIPHPPLRKDCPPLIICRVCTLWRDIAIKDPFLWTHIAFDYPVWDDYIHSDEEYGSDGEELTPSRDEGPVVEDYQRLMRRVQLFVQRAGNAPLSLTIGNNPTDKIRVANPSPTLQACKQNAFKLMISLFPRCRSVEFYAEHGWGISFFRGLVQGVFSNLERLEINFSHELTSSPPAEAKVFTLSSHHNPTRERWMEDSRGLIPFLTIDENQQKEENFLPPLPRLRTLILYYGDKTLG